MEDMEARSVGMFSETKRSDWKVQPWRSRTRVTGCRDPYVMKTKLLYHFDVEFYRAHGQSFTGFQWKYFHLGPLTKEFDPPLESLFSKDELIEQVSDRSEFDTRFLRFERNTRF